MHWARRQDERCCSNGLYTRLFCTLYSNITVTIVTITVVIVNVTITIVTVGIVIVTVTIAIVTVTIAIVTVTIAIVTVTIDIVTVTITVVTNDSVIWFSRLTGVITPSTAFSLTIQLSL